MTATTFKRTAREGVRTAKDLFGIAEEILERSLKGETFKTAEMEDEYDLSEQQMQKVKRYTKSLAAEQGVLWGYDPGLNKFRCCPMNARTIAHSMFTYYTEQWASQGAAFYDMLESARRMGFIDNRSASRRGRQADRITQNIEALGVLVTRNLSE